MKSFRKLTALLLSVLAVSFMACDPKEEDVFGKPVKDKDFTVTVDGNNLIVECTNKAMTSVLWEVNTGVQSTQKKDTLYFPIAGDYTILLSVSNGGDYISADIVNFTIASTDAEYYNKGIWKALTGGAGVKKTWVLDVEKKFFHNPIDFYGDAEAGLGADGKSWGPWGGTSIYDWGGTPEEGEISFDATTGTLTVTIDGVTKSGKYNFNTFDRPEDFISPALEGVTLWENFLTGKYNYLGTLSAEMGDLKFPAGLRFPMDRGRITNDSNAVNPSQFLTSDLENVTILHCSDSSMIVRVKRTYEGDKESKCWLLYNFRVKEYTYTPEVLTYTPQIKTGFTAADLVGTWKFGPAPVNWINYQTEGNKGTYVEQGLLNAWVAQTDVADWMASQEQLTAAQANTYVFNNDGTCMLNGVANTYTVANGVITFGTALTTEFNVNWFNLTGTSVTVIDVKGGTNASLGIWIGYQNESKPEFVAANLVKQ